ncbi:hypothetical protein JCM3774_002242 [Rhodotorula dairenensis]
MTGPEAQEVARPAPVLLRNAHNDRELPPLPVTHLEHAFAEASPPYEARTSTRDQSGPSLSSPPPYRGDGPRTGRVGPLSLFPFRAEPPCPSAGSATDILRLQSRFSTTPSLLAPPPSYAETPRTQAERLFWIGWLLPPFLWLFGASRIWRSEAPRELKLQLKQEGLPMHIVIDGNGEAENEAEADVGESLQLWRQEELVWARRCLWAITGSLMLGTLMGVMLASVTGKI